MTCQGCVACRQGPDSRLVCDACSTPSAPYAPYALYMHTRREGSPNVTEIRPAEGAPALAYRTRQRGTRTAQVPVCPGCQGELVRR